MDILLPALLKRRWRGFVSKIRTDPSSLALGTSVGLFALVYRLVFRQTALILDRILVRARNQRRDSGVHLDKGVVNVGVGTHKKNQVKLAGQKGHEGHEEDDRQVKAAELASKLSKKRLIPAIIATLLASPAFALIPEQTRRLSLAMYSLTYSGEILYAALDHSGYMAWLPSWCGIWTLFPFTVSFCTHLFLHHTDSCPSGMLSLIMSQSSPYLLRPPQFNVAVHGPYPPARDILRAVTNALRAGPNTHALIAAPGIIVRPTLTAEAAATGTFLIPASCAQVLHATEHMGFDSEMCRLFHANTTSCTRAMMTLLKRDTVYTFKMYSTLAAITFLARGGCVFQDGILSYFKKTGIQIFRSMLCVTGITTTSLSVCGLERALPTGFLTTKR
ncbi:hypothetical protein EDD11_003196 [Mortierella claussenii]|nr:hypothetical protein EDD11_003196 [Mortierella claussenii]